MKKRIFQHILTPIACALCMTSTAQIMFREGQCQYKAGEHILIIHQDATNKKSLVIKEENNDSIFACIVKDTRRTIRLENVRYASHENIASSFTNILGKKRIIELSDERPLMVTVYIDYLGKVISVKYHISRDTRLTLAELDKVTSYLKENVAFAVPPGLDRNASMVPIIQRVPIIKEKIHSLPDIKDRPNNLSWADNSLLNPYR